MSYSIYFLTPAAFELDEAFNWYENIQAELGVRFVDQIDAYLNLLKKIHILFQNMQILMGCIRFR